MMRLIKRMIRMLFGNYRIAIWQGLKTEEGVTVMEGVGFGSEPYLIHLRKYSRISSNVMFITHDGGTWAFRNDNEHYKNVIKFGTIEVGEYSFVGANTTILPNVKIGSHCVIGAGSVVTKDIPDGMVAVGVPARIICSTKDYAEKSKLTMPPDFDEKAFMQDKRKYLSQTMWH